MRADGLTLRQLGEHFGVRIQTVHAWLSDPDGARLRERKNSYRGECSECGASTDGSAGPNQAPDLCAKCNGARRGALTATLMRERAEPRRQRIVELWNTGLSMNDIADALGMTSDSLGGVMATMREQGYNLPHRYELDPAAQYARDKALADRIEPLWQAGLTSDQIADEVGMPRGSVRFFVSCWMRPRGYDVPLRPAGFRRQAESVASQDFQQPQEGPHAGS